MSTGKRTVHMYDTPLPTTVGAADPITTSVDTALPQVVAGPAPSGLALVSTVYQQSLTTPRAVINVAWDEPISGVTEYVVQVADNAGFTGARTIRAHSTAAALEVDAPAVTAVNYFIRVAALYGQIQSGWSNVATVAVQPDLTPPPPVSGLSVAFDADANLVITFTRPSANNYRDALVNIYSDSSHTTLYDTFYVGTSRATWTPAQNLARTSGTGADVVYVEVTSRAYGGALSSAVSASATMPAPAVPALIAANFSGKDLVLRWSSQPGISTYRVTLDGTARIVAQSEYVYTFDANRQEHSGTPDPVVNYSIVAINALKRESFALTGTATNLPPDAPSNVDVLVGSSAVLASVSGTPPADLLGYDFTIYKNSAAVRTIRETVPTTTQVLESSGTYTVGVKVVDAFGQVSGETLSSPFDSDILTIGDIRAEVMYDDDIGSSQSTLAKLKDGNSSSDGVAYNALTGSNYHITRAKRPFLEHIRNITCSASNGTGYISTSQDGVTWTFFSGPLTVNAATGATEVLTEVADEAAARAAEASLPFIARWVLPRRVEARFVRLHHHNASLYQLYEFLPRAEVIADDFVGEIFRGMRFNGVQMVADKLSAITATLGSVNISEWCSIGTSGGVYQGTGTAAAPNTGLKLWNSSGVGRLAAYNGGVEQVALDTDGRLKAGAGAITLDATGLKTYNGATIQVSIGTDGALTAGAGAVRTDSQGVTFAARDLTGDPTGASSQATNVKWLSGATVVASVEGYTRAGGKYMSIDADAQVLFHTGQVRIAPVGGGSTLLNVFGTITGTALSTTGPISGGQFFSFGPLTGNGDAYIRTNKSGNACICITGGSYQDFYSTTNTDSGAQIRLNSNQGIFGYGSLDLMGGAGGSTGQIRMFTNDSVRMTVAKTGEIGISTAPISNHRLRVQGVTSGSSGYTFTATNSGGSALMYLRDDGYSWVNQNWAVGSDVKLKDDVKDLTTATEMVRKIKPKQYKRKANGRTEYGVVAQDLQAIAPELVSNAVTANGEEVLAVDYTSLFMLGLRAMQELAEQASAQQQRIDDIRNELAYLTNAVNQIGKKKE